MLDAPNTPAGSGAPRRGRRRTGSPDGRAHHHLADAQLDRRRGPPRHADGGRAAEIDALGEVHRPAAVLGDGRGEEQRRLGDVAGADEPVDVRGIDARIGEGVGGEPGPLLDGERRGAVELPLGGSLGDADDARVSRPPHATHLRRRPPLRGRHRTFGRGNAHFPAGTRSDQELRMPIPTEAAERSRCGGQRFGGSERAYVTPRVTHPPSCRFVRRPAASTRNHPSIERPRISNRRTCSRRDQPFGLVRVDTDEEATLAAGTHRQVAADEEPEPAEHAPLGDPTLLRYELPDAVGQLLVERHAPSVPRCARGARRRGDGRITR